MFKPEELTSILKEYLFVNQEEGGQKKIFVSQLDKTKRKAFAKKLFDIFDMANNGSDNITALRAVINNNIIPAEIFDIKRINAKYNEYNIITRCAELDDKLYKSMSDLALGYERSDVFLKKNLKMETHKATARDISLLEYFSINDSGKIYDLVEKLSTKSLVSQIDKGDKLLIFKNNDLSSSAEVVVKQLLNKEKYDDLLDRDVIVSLVEGNNAKLAMSILKLSQRQNVIESYFSSSDDSRRGKTILHDLVLAEKAVNKGTGNLQVVDYLVDILKEMNLVPLLEKADRTNRRADDYISTSHPSHQSSKDKINNLIRDFRTNELNSVIGELNGNTSPKNETEKGGVELVGSSKQSFWSKLFGKGKS